MRWLWVVVLLSTFFWLGTVPVFTPAPPVWLWIVAAAILLAGAGLGRAGVKEISPVWLLALLPLGVAALSIPFPYSLPAVLLGIAILLLAAVRFSSALAWVGLPVGLTGLILTVQMAVLPLLHILSSRVHEIPWLTPLLYGLVRAFEPEASLSEGLLIIHHVNDNCEFMARPEALGLIPGALIIAGGLLVLSILRRSSSALLGFIGLVAGYSVLRYVFLIFLTVKFNTPGVFWLPLHLALSYIPLVIILAAVDWEGGTRGSLEVSLKRPVALKRALLAFALMAAGVFALIGFFAFHDPGVRKDGRVLIDELHSDWEWTTLKYDTEWYGRKSGYNYYCLAEYLKLHYEVHASRDSLLGDLLAGYDVVMLKTPTSPYSEREIDALEEFVRHGGGLWLVGDHTNVFGTSTYLNDVGGRFGLRFRYDSTYDLSTMALSRYSRPALFAHPTVAFLPCFLFATSCTMESPFASENMILGYGLKAMRLDYSQKSFFPRKTDKNYSFGVFVQQGGVKYGKGRVAGFTDSTCFSNFFMFIPGKPELVLATVEWLNRMNRFGWLNPVLLALGLALLVAGGVAVRRWTRSEQAIAFAAAGLLGFAVAVMVYDGHVRRSYSLPRAHTDFVHVAFESEHSAFTLPTMGLTKVPEASLHTFYVWTQRLGFFPSHEKTLEEALGAGDLVIVANPTLPLDDAETAALEAYLDAGGRLLILVDPLNREDAQARLLEAVGVGLDRQEADMLRGVEAGDDGEAPGVEALAIVDLEGKVVAAAARPTGLVGGTPLLLLSDGRVVLTEARIGEGRVFVFADFLLFTVSNMGHTGEPIGERRHAISELEYWMLREILSDS